MRITFRQAPPRAIARMLAILRRRQRRVPRGRPVAPLPSDDNDLAQRVRLSGEW
jgi:hypothetical protein